MVRNKQQLADLLQTNPELQGTELQRLLDSQQPIAIHLKNSNQFLFKLDFPPSINTFLWKRFKPKAWTACQEQAEALARGLQTQQLVGSLRIEYFLQKSDFRRYDILNCTKAIEDGFTKGGLWMDDYQIDSASFDRLSVIKDEPACVYLRVTQIADTPFFESDKKKPKSR